MIRVATRPNNAVRERVAIRRHAVGRGDGAQGADVVVGATVAHHADGLHRQEDREGLPDLVIEAGLIDLVQVDRIGLAQEVELLARDVAGHADGEAGAGERVAAEYSIPAGRARGPGRAPRP